MNYTLEDKGERQAALKGVKRVVIKIGTRLLMDVKGETPEERVQKLIAEVAELRKSGMEVVVVTSGAIGAAIRVLEAQRRPKKLAMLQAYAAVGQCHLMTLYENACTQFGFHCSQLLVTAADLHDRERHLTVAQCLDALLDNGILPVINENDSVCVDEIKVGDNDTLAALVASLCRADLTILLTTINGMKERDINTGELKERISVVHELKSDIFAMAQGTDGNAYSVGGMITKLRAAAMTTCCGEPLWIAEGFDFSNLRRIFHGEDIGTLFVPATHNRLHARQRFIAFFANPEGELIIDEGAEEALCHKGKSLLPSGIIGMRGVFSPGATVKICNIHKKELARGTVNFSTSDLSKICGVSTDRLEACLGYKPAANEAVHRNALVQLTIDN